MVRQSAGGLHEIVKPAPVAGFVFQEIKLAAWTFPVYATNALLGMAQIYHKQVAYEKLINTFEHWLQLFSQVYKHEEDFTLNLYWGDFLVAYAGLAYVYK